MGKSRAKVSVDERESDGAFERMRELYGSLRQAALADDARPLENLRWVHTNLRVPLEAISTEGVPSVAAVGELETAREDPKSWMGTYYRQLQRYEELDAARMHDDGRSLVSECESLLAMRAKAMAEEGL